MIRRLKYSEIDFEKYSNCLKNSEQHKYCATREFLDITAGKNWQLLVYKDYKAVMPVPFVEKFGVKFVHQPKLCQQLGIFSEADLPEINDLFLDFLKRKYMVRYYAFNDRNIFSQPLPTRKNFLINPESYEAVARRYSPKRKRKIRQEPEIRENSEIRLNVPIDEVSSFILENIRGAEGNKRDPQEFYNIFRAFSEAGLLSLEGFYYHDSLTNLIAVYDDGRTVALLGTFNDHRFVKLSGASVLIDDCLRRNIESKIFDFEGGDIPNIEEFFRGFRPEMQPYSYISNTKQELVKKFFTVIF